MPTTLDFHAAIQPDWEALAIAEMWTKYNIFRLKKIEDLKELRNYLFAVDTLSTSGKKTPWANSTTTPKLTQIRDNIHANTMAALFPQEKFFKWEAHQRVADTLRVRRAIEGYVGSKARLSGYKNTISRLVLDWIDTGNCFGIVDYHKDFLVKENGLVLPAYQGPQLRRISMYDIVFNPLAPSFAESPKIVKELVSVGDLVKSIKKGDDWKEGALEDMIRIRGTVSGQDSEIHKGDGYVADGFSNYTQYLQSGYVELLHFFGDIYNSTTGELKTDQMITVADRAKVLRAIEAPGPNGANVIRHSAWRKRPDNLYGMGPLENLVGMQYRIDHLENLKADVFDQIAYPQKKVRGEVQDFGDDLGERIYMDTEGDVSFLVPDATALNADMQIGDLANKMEELAGAPRSAMGIRTPGEKTAFEVDVLNTGSNRIFEHKAGEFEDEMIEPTLNDYLVEARMNMGEVEEIMLIDEGTGQSIFKEISPEDITGNGLLRPKGAKHFAERQRRIGNLSNLHQMKLSDPSIGAHMSGKEFARLITEELGEERLFSEWIAIYEQTEGQRISQEVAVNMEEENMSAAEAGV
jgi:hypothetical protein